MRERQFAGIHKQHHKATSSVGLTMDVKIRNRTYACRQAAAGREGELAEGMRGTPALVGTEEHGIADAPAAIIPAL
jgi:hypothetical protein